MGNQIPNYAKENGKENWIRNSKKPDRGLYYKTLGEKYLDLLKEEKYPRAGMISFTKKILIKKWDKEERKKTDTTLFTILKENFRSIIPGLNEERLAYLALMHMAYNQKANVDMIPKEGIIEVKFNKMTIKDKEGNVFNDFENVEVLPMKKEINIEQGDSDNSRESDVSPAVIEESDDKSPPVIVEESDDGSQPSEGGGNSEKVPPAEEPPIESKSDNREEEKQRKQREKENERRIAEEAQRKEEERKRQEENERKSQEEENRTREAERQKREEDQNKQAQEQQEKNRLRAASEKTRKKTIESLNIYSLGEKVWAAVTDWWALKFELDEYYEDKPAAVQGNIKEGIQQGFDVIHTYDERKKERLIKSIDQTWQTIDKLKFDDTKGSLEKQEKEAMKEVADFGINWIYALKRKYPASKEKVRDILVDMGKLGGGKRGNPAEDKYNQIMVEKLKKIFNIKDYLKIAKIILNYVGEKAGKGTGEVMDTLKMGKDLLILTTRIKTTNKVTVDDVVDLIYIIPEADFKYLFDKYWETI